MNKLEMEFFNFYLEYKICKEKSISFFWIILHLDLVLGRFLGVYFTL